MSPHGDLIAFGLCLLVLAFPLVWYLLSLIDDANEERKRHNRAVERASWRLYWQIRRLGDCDGTENPPVSFRSVAEAENAIIRGGRS